MIKDKIVTICGSDNNNYRYCYVSYHHESKPSKEKSVWKISEISESELFIGSFFLSDAAVNTFNVLIKDGKLLPVGSALVGGKITEQYLCFFVNKSKSPNPFWHGFPVNHMDQTRLLPGPDFYNSGPGSLLCAHDLKRLKKGKPL